MDTPVTVSYKSLPKIIRSLIENGNSSAFESEILKLKYGFGIKRSARYYFEQKNKLKKVE